MNEIITLLGGILIVGASYVFANKQKKENIRLEEENEGLKNEIRILEDVKISIDGHRSQLIEDKNKLKEEKKELVEIIEFDNDLMTKKTEKIEELNDNIKSAEFEIAGLRYELEDMKKIGFRKIFKAERLVTGVIGEKVNNLYKDDMKGLEG